MNKTRRLMMVAILSALAIVINLFESAFIPPVQFGIRFGLANIMALVAIHLLGPKEMWMVNALRVTVGNLLKGMLFGSMFWISFAGVIFSGIAIHILYRLKSSLLFTSIVSAIAHSLGQVVMVMFLYQQANIIVILPILMISSVLTGILTGIIAKESLKRIKI